MTDDAGGPSGRRGNLTSEEIEAAMKEAERAVRKWLRLLPPVPDPEAFVTEACVAVLLAAQRFEEGRGPNFPTYARYLATFARQDEARRQDSLSRGRRKRHQASGDEPSAGELPPLSLEELTGAEESEAWQVDPSPGPEERALQAETAAEVTAALAVLTDRELEVVFLRIWLEEPSRTVAAELGISQTRVCQIEKRAFQKLQPLLARLDPDSDPDDDPCSNGEVRSKSLR